MNRKLFSIFFLLCFSIAGYKSQDFIFTQYFASQPYLNPALTGFFDGSYRVTAQYRNQWAPINSGINTYGISADYKFGNNDPEEDYFAVGLNVYRDEIFKRISYNTGRFTGSYTKRLGYGSTAHYLSIGGNFGWELKQYSNASDMMPNGLPPDPKMKSSIMIPNMGLGLNYQIVFPTFANVFFGGAVNHLVSGSNSLNSNTSVLEEKRITVYSSGRLKVREDKLFLLPTILVTNQASFKQVNFGVAAQILTRKYFDTRGNFQIGVYGRLGNDAFDAVMLMLRYENRGIQLGISYDHNLNALSGGTSGYGATEISIGYIGLISRVIKSRAECPDMKNF